MCTKADVIGTSQQKSKSMSNISMLTLKITLDDSEPTVWRTIRIREDLPLTQVHDRIQGAMGWNDSHLHLFKIGGIEYADHELWEDPVDMADERIMTLKNAKLKVGDSFSYLYDMGDDWQHTITVEKRTKVDSEHAESWVVDGANACPPEDVGGVGGYEQFLMSLADPANELHEAYKQWYGIAFDATHFDIRSARRILLLLDHFGKGYPWIKD